MQKAAAGMNRAWGISEVTSGTEWPVVGLLREIDSHTGPKRQGEVANMGGGGLD